ncbi:MAG: M14 family metallopeptidase [Chloroflexota bacterium]
MSMKQFLKLVGVLLAVIYLLTTSPAAASLPTPENPISTTQQTPIPPGMDEPYWVVRAYYTDRQMVDRLAQWLEPWEVHHDQGYLVVGVNQSDYNLLETLGFRLEVDQQLTKQINSPRQVSPLQTSGIPGFSCYRTVEETFASAQAIVDAHPHLASWNDIGDSWDKIHSSGTSGYDLQVLRLTNDQIPGPKPKLFIMSSIHAREYTPAELNTRFAEHLVNLYDQDPDITWLLDYQEIHLLLQSNPDGRKYAETGLLWRKNTNQNYCSPASIYRGADLNRNFAFQWACCGGSSGSPCNETYRGPTAASEPETQAIQSYLRSEFEDRREDLLTDPAPTDTMGLFIDLHSYSNLVLWPWGFTSTPAPNGLALQTLGRKFAYFNHYIPEQASGLYPTDGATDDFAYGDLGLAAYTFELGNNFFETCSFFENTILPQNLPALLYAAKAARRPYMSPAGPDILSVGISTDQVIPGEPIQLTATADDTRYQNTLGAEPVQNIAAVEYSIDIPDWTSDPAPTFYAMSPVDGAFNQTIENVTATIDTSSLSPGRHILFIRGQDAAGNWGPPTAYFFSIQHVFFFPLMPVP